MAPPAPARATAPARAPASTKGARRAGRSARATGRRGSGASAAPVRRSAPSRARAQATPLPGRLVPLAVGGATVAVGGLADSGLMVRLTRGRLWIGLLGVLLVGIVALNVMALSLNASSSRIAGEVDDLKRANSELGARVAGKLSDQRIQNAAARLGLVVPEPGSIAYLRPSRAHAAVAAERLKSGEITPTAIPPEEPALGAEQTATAEGATDAAPAGTEAPAGAEAPFPAAPPAP